ncbi:MAG: tetratricopeptide repeat protein [Euryarchaeota archaeon]
MKARKFYQRAIKSQKKEEYPEALILFQKALEIDPGCYKAHTERGYVYGNMEDFKEALKSFDSSLNIKITPHGLYGKALTLYHLQEYTDAMLYFQKVVDIEPNEWAYFYIASCHFYSGEFESALKSLNEAILLNSEFKEAWNDKGVIYSILKNDEKALDSFQQVLEIDPDYLSAIYNMGTTLADSGNYPEALEYLNKFLEKDPENFKALLYKANVLVFMDLPEDALNYFEEALIQNPDSPEAWNYKGCVLSSLGKSKEAITSFKRAIKSSPEYVAAYLNLANVYKELNMLENAKKSLDKVLKISPDNEEALKENESLKMNN